MWQYTIYTIILPPIILFLFMSIGYFWLSGFFPKRKWARALLFVIVGSLIWIIGNFIELGLTDAALKIFYYKVQYVGSIIIPIAWLVFAAYYTGAGRFVSIRNLGLVLIIPAITVVLVFTNEYHHLMFTGFEAENYLGQYLVINKFYGLWATWINAPYMFTIMAFSIMLIAISLFKRKNISKIISFGFLITALLPITLGSLFIFGKNPFIHLESTPIFMSISVIVIMRILYSLRNGEITLLGRQNVIDGINEGFAVLDTNNMIIDVNDRFAEIFSESRYKVLGKPLIGLPCREALPGLDEKIKKMLDEKDADPVFIIQNKGSKKYFDINISNITDKYKRKAGIVLTVLDITGIKENEIKMKHLSSILYSIRGINQLITQETDREKLLKGICKSLAANRNYFDAWIMTLKSDGTFLNSYSSKNGKNFKEFSEYYKKGMIPECINKLLKTDGMPHITRRYEECGDCPRARKNLKKFSMTAVLKGKEWSHGYMGIAVSGNDFDSEEEISLFDEIAQDVSLALDRMVLNEIKQKSDLNLKESYKKIKKTLDGTLSALASIVEIRDPHTSGHQNESARLAAAIAKELGLSDRDIEIVKTAAIVHDIGKIYIPQSILSKPGTITEIEYNLIKAHVQKGYNILKNVEYSEPIAEIVLQHHERNNGTGYPNGLRGTEILFKTKILIVADVVGAMSSHRPYRPAIGIKAALEEVKINKGILYEPEIVDKCIELFHKKKFKFNNIV